MSRAHLTVNYNSSFFYMQTLNYWAKKFLKYLPLEVNTLVCKGMSGCAIASAMCALSDRDLSVSVIRKKEDTAHSSGHGGSYLSPSSSVAIVDDFTSTGETLKSILEGLSIFGVKPICIMMGCVDENIAPEIRHISIGTLED